MAATVDRTTTQSELANLYMDNCGYAEAVDVGMARRFVTVCRAMMSRGMTGYESAGGTKMNFAPSVLGQEIQAASSFIRANDPARRKSQAIRLRFGGFQ